MRVAHVITRLIVGGAQENTIATVLGLRKQPGVTVELVAGPTRGAEGSLEHSFCQQGGRLSIVPSLVRPISPWHDILALRALTRQFRAATPDIVHTHSGKAGLLGRLAAARAGVPVIIHTIHGPSFGPFQNPLSNALFRAAERRAGKVTTHFVVVADAMKAQYLAAGIGTAAQYTKILSGFDLQPFLDARENRARRGLLGLKESDVVVGMIARLFKLKGHDDLFAIAPAVIQANPAVKFLLVGDGPWRQRFENLADALNLRSHFVFAGLVPPAEVPSLVGAMDMLAHLSRREGLARALPQALAAARPVIAYDCDGAREVCVDSETGFLVHPGDLAAVRDRLVRLAGDPALRAKLGAAGRAFVKPLFSVDVMVGRIYDLYVRLMSSAGRAGRMGSGQHEIRTAT
jgi:glycosyltransferase involved in cell wall biosynthesis